MNPMTGLKVKNIVFSFFHSKLNSSIQSEHLVCRRFLIIMVNYHEDLIIITSIYPDSTWDDKNKCISKVHGFSVYTDLHGLLSCYPSSIFFLRFMSKFEKQLLKTQSR